MQIGKTFTELQLPVFNFNGTVSTLAFIFNMLR